MKSAWHLVGHTSELASPGDFINLPVFGTEGIAVMNYEGYFHAWDGRCPHRGARIFGNETHGNRLPVCGYHNRCAKPTLTPGLVWQSIGGFIFVSSVRDLRRIDDLSSAHQFLCNSPDGLRLISRQQFVMDCDWRVAVENALDLEHVPHVHAQSLARLGLTRASLLKYGDGSSIEYMDSKESARLDKIEPLFSHSIDHDYVHAHFFPYAAVSSTRGFTYSLQNYFPTPDGRTWFLHRLYAMPASGAAQSYVEGVARINAQVFAEDAEICAQVPPWPEFVGKLGPADDRIAVFRDGLLNAGAI